MRRYFIRVSPSGFIDQEMEYAGPEADSAPMPGDMIEMTADPRWTGQSFLRWTLLNNVFTPPAPMVTVDPVKEQLDRIEATLTASVSTKST